MLWSPHIFGRFLRCEHTPRQTLVDDDKVMGKTAIQQISLSLTEEEEEEEEEKDVGRRPSSSILFVAFWTCLGDLASNATYPPLLPCSSMRARRRRALKEAL